MPTSPVGLPPELKAAIDSLVLPGHSQLRAAVRRLCERYREGRATSISDDADVLAYVLCRMPATYAATYAALRQTALVLPNWAPRSLLDVGAGPGTAAWAALRVFPTLREVRLVEHDARMREIGQRLGSADRVLARATWSDELADDPAELVVASYALGEMQSAVAAHVWESARHVLVVVESGTPRGYRVVLDARRMALADGGHVAAPCPHDGECPLRCPVWCHFSQRLPRDLLHRSLKVALLPWEDEKFSYVAVSKAAAAPARARVIGRPRYGKHLVRLPLCTPHGLTKRSIAKSDVSYRAARRASWGDAFE